MEPKKQERKTDLPVRLKELSSLSTLHGVHRNPNTNIIEID